MQCKKTPAQTWLTHRLTLIIVFLTMGSVAHGQITRDVGQIAVIEGDSNIIVASCNNKVRVSMQELAKKFYETHPNEFHFLIMFTNFDQMLNPDANCNERFGAFYLPVSNSIRGIGRSTFDASVAFGSSGRVLAGVINMNQLANWPANPAERFGANSLLSVLGQEVGHSWGAFVRFDSDPGPGISASADLLGRDQAHWSFFITPPAQPAARRSLKHHH